MNSYFEKYKECFVNSYDVYNIVLEHGSGSYVYDINNREYLDFTSGIGVNSLGHCNKKIVEALKEQAENLIHTSNLFLNKNAVCAAEKLLQLTGMKKVFFSNSGAESNEGAIKIARKYSYDKYGEGRSDIITLKNSFHGRTITTLKATGQEKFHKYFYPFTEGFLYSNINDIVDFKNTISNNVCAVMVELVQGEGGIISVEKSYIENVAKICKEKDILLIIDEVQTGVGRTGKFLATQYFDIKPDIITLAKGLGGGVPVGAVLCSEKTKNTISYGDHGSTFGGNPLVTACVNVVLDEFLQSNIIDEIIRKSNFIFENLNLLKSDDIVSIKGCGLMIGIKVKKETKYYINKAKDKGLLILSAGDNTLRLLPPLNVSNDDIFKCIEILKEIF